MTHVIKCDRCGAIYEKNEKYMVTVPGRKIPVTQVCTGKSDDNIDEFFDLCDDCLTKFYNFIIMAGEKKGENND